MSNPPRVLQWLTRLDTTRAGIGRAILILGGFFSAELMVHTGSNFVENYTMGRLGAEYLSALTLSLVIVDVPLTLLFELGTGTTVLVAQHIGAGNPSAAAVAIGQMILLVLLISLPISAAGILLAPTLLRLMGAEATVAQIGVPYLRVCFASAAVLVLPLALNGALRGLGHASQAFGLEFMMTVFMAILMPLLVFGLGPFPRLTIRGSILALVGARALALGIQLAFLSSRASAVCLRLDSFRPDRPTMQRLWALSLPLAGQQLARVGASMAVFRLVAAFGTAAVAGYALCLQFLRIPESFAQGVGNAAFTVVGQNLGAGLGRRALRGVKLATVAGCASVSLSALAIFALAPPLVGFFSHDPAVTAMGVAALRVISLSTVFNAVAYVITRSFHGAGNTVSPLVADLATLWLVQIPLALALSKLAGWQTGGIWAAVAVAYAARAVLLAFLFRRRALPQFLGQSSVMAARGD